MKERSSGFELMFKLTNEDGWPPVSVEGLPCEPLATGRKVLAPPLFVKDLSVDDVILATFDDQGHVSSWRHLSRSRRSTVWLLRIAPTDQIQSVLADVRRIGCSTVQLPDYGCYAIDVPETVSMGEVDGCLDRLDSSAVAVAYPSLRHLELKD
ncbi:MAG: DUF4265 domain-containing protein [Pseudomonadales bacterium]|nr:DUF4265 domain-containing protein [Xanthomonadales bacterium]MBP6481850.1 DUF4265 domain-containing protein [Pseudomonadales bacterium]